MINHENSLLADDSHEISNLFRKLGKMLQNLLSAAVVIGALLVKHGTQPMQIVGGALKVKKTCKGVTVLIVSHGCIRTKHELFEYTLICVSYYFNFYKKKSDNQSVILGSSVLTKCFCCDWIYCCFSTRPYGDESISKLER